MTPIFRFTLYNDILGAHVISDPIGWDTCELSMERHPKYHSLIKTLDGDFIFYGSNGQDDGGFNYTTQCIREQGHRCKMFLGIEMSMDMGVTFDDLWYGQMDVSQKEKIEGGDIRQIKMPVLRGDAWNTFINYQGNKVDIRSTTTIGGEGCSAADFINLLMKSQEIAFKTEYDGHSGFIDTVNPCTTATSSNITLSGLQTINGVVTTPGMRVLVKAQSSSAANGIYNAQTGAWSRATDANTAGELTGCIVTVTDGTQAGVYRQTLTVTTVGTSAQTWTSYNYISNDIFYETNASATVNVTNEIMIYFTPTVDPIVKEIEESYTLPVTAVEDPNDLSEQIEIANGYGTMTIEWDLLWKSVTSFLYTGTATMEDRTIELSLYMQINDDTPVLLDSTTSNFVVPDTNFKTLVLNSVTNIDVAQGDRIKIYCYHESYTSFDTNSGTYTQRRVIGGLEHSNVKFTFNSKQQENQVSAFFLHDVGGAILDRITNDPGLFYSSYFGSPATKYRSYASEGPEWKYALVRGLQLRNYPLTEKPYFTNWDTWWEGVDNIFCLGMDPTVISGQERWEVLPRALLYDSSTVSTDFLGVPRIMTTTDMANFYKKVKIGFAKWQSEDVNGIDDPQTQREYASKFHLFGEEIELYSTFIAASLAIEITRRKSQEESTDWKYDDNEFIIALGSDLLPEQGASSVSGLNNPDSRYNIRLSATRSMDRFMGWLSNCLQEYPGEVAYTFQEGVGNFRMTADLNDGSAVEGPFTEDQDFNIYASHSLFPEFKSFETTSAWEQWLDMENNRRLAVGASAANHGYVKLLTQKVSFKPAKGTLSFSGWPAEPF